MMLRVVKGESAIDEGLIAQVREFVEIFFQQRCVLAPEMSLQCPVVRQLDDEDGDVQVAALPLLEEVSSASAELDPERETIAVLALTSFDLFLDDCMFVFGHASPRHKACVCSVTRLGEDVSREQFLRRTLVTLVHEAGHLVKIGLSCTC